jgi:hypothetical protein
MEQKPMPKPKSQVPTNEVDEDDEFAEVAKTMPVQPVTPRLNSHIQKALQFIPLIQDIRDRLGFKPRDPDFIITGSFMYAMQGLAVQVNDIDILITKYDDELKLKLKAISEMWPRPKEWGEEKEYGQPYRFFMPNGVESVKVDIFLLERPDAPYGRLICEDFVISPLMASIGQKASYCRVKDFKALYAISKQIFPYHTMADVLGKIR